MNTPMTRPPTLTPTAEVLFAQLADLAKIIGVPPPAPPAPDPLHLPDQAALGLHLYDLQPDGSVKWVPSHEVVAEARGKGIQIDGRAAEVLFEISDMRRYRMCRKFRWKFVLGVEQHILTNGWVSRSQRQSIRRIYNSYHVASERELDSVVRFKQQLCGEPPKPKEVRVVYAQDFHDEFKKRVMASLAETARLRERWNTPGPEPALVTAPEPEPKPAPDPGAALPSRKLRILA